MKRRLADSRRRFHKSARKGGCGWNGRAQVLPGWPYVLSETAGAKRATGRLNIIRCQHRRVDREFWSSAASRSISQRKTVRTSSTRRIPAGKRAGDRACERRRCCLYPERVRRPAACAAGELEYSIRQPERAKWTEQQKLSSSRLSTTCFRARALWSWPTIRAFRSPACRSSARR